MSRTTTVRARLGARVLAATLLITATAVTAPAPTAAAAGAVGPTPAIDVAAAGTTAAARLGVGYDPSHRGALDDIRRTVAVRGGRVDRVDAVLNFAVVEVSAARRPALESALRARPGVTAVERDTVVHATFTPNDQFWPYQWGPRYTGVGTAWETGTSATGAPCTATAPCLGSHNTVIAILDTGIDWTHPDIAPNYCFDGPNYFSQSARPWDDHGHGTAVAGAASAKIHNHYDVAGVSDSCLVAVKVLGPDGRGSAINLASAIRWAADNGVDVVNMSLGSDGGNFFEEQAIDYAWSKGVLLVAAAGNDGCGAVDFPAAYPKVVAVGALGTTTQRASFSDCGPQIEIAAPGDDIYTTDRWCCTRSVSGTSIASPLVASAAALLWDRKPTLSAAQVRCLLDDTADDLGAAGHDQETGHGRLDVDGGAERLASGAALLPWPNCGNVAPGPPRTDEQVFTGGNDAIVECMFNIGGACWDIAPGDTTVGFTIDNIALLGLVESVPGTYRFLGSNGDVVAAGTFCTSVSGLAVPVTAARVEVRVGGPVEGTVGCGVPHPTSFGLLEARFNAA